MLSYAWSLWVIRDEDGLRELDEQSAEVTLKRTGNVCAMRQPAQPVVVEPIADG